MDATPGPPATVRSRLLTRGLVVDSDEDVAARDYRGLRKQGGLRARASARVSSSPRAAECLYVSDGTALVAGTRDLGAGSSARRISRPEGGAAARPTTLAAEALDPDAELGGGLDVLTGDAVYEESVEVFDGYVWAAAPVLLRAGLAVMDDAGAFARVRW